VCDRDMGEGVAGVDGREDIEVDLAWTELNRDSCEGDDGLYVGTGDVEGVGGGEEAVGRGSGTVPKVVASAFSRLNSVHMV
jgi:hypothetical protein